MYCSKHHKVGVQLNESLSFLHKDMSHFICKIIHDCFHFEHKCFFTGQICEMDLEKVQSICEEIKKKAIIANQPIILLEKLDV